MEIDPKEINQIFVNNLDTIKLLYCNVCFSHGEKDKASLMDLGKDMLRLSLKMLQDNSSSNFEYIKIVKEMSKEANEWYKLEKKVKDE